METSVKEELNASFWWLIANAVNYRFVDLNDDHMNAELMQLCYERGMFDSNEHNENNAENDLKFMIRMINGYYDPPSQPQIRKAKAIICGSLLPRARMWYRKYADVGEEVDYCDHELIPKDNENEDSVLSVRTYYNGTSYRSRLEAKVAVLLDELKIKYEYEKTVLTMTDEENEEIRYLPDFTIEQDGKNIVIEAKGLRDTCEEEIKKALKFVGTQIDYLVVISEIPRGNEAIWWFPVFYWNNMDERAVMRRCLFRAYEDEGRINMHYDVAAKQEIKNWNKNDLNPVPSSLFEKEAEHRVSNIIDDDEYERLSDAFYAADSRVFGYGVEARGSI